jgi:hypothetical protein
MSQNRSPLMVVKTREGLAVVLPKEAQQRLAVHSAGDQVSCRDTKNGIELTPYDQELESQLEIGREIIWKNRIALKKLAE